MAFIVWAIAPRSAGASVPVRAASLESTDAILLVRTTQGRNRPPDAGSEMGTSSGQSPAEALVIIASHSREKSAWTGTTAITSAGLRRVSARSAKGKSTRTMSQTVGAGGCVATVSMAQVWGSRSLSSGESHSVKPANGSSNGTPRLGCLGGAFVTRTRPSSIA